MLSAQKNKTLWSTLTFDILSVQYAYKILGQFMQTTLSDHYVVVNENEEVYC